MPALAAIAAMALALNTMARAQSTVPSGLFPSITGTPTIQNACASVSAAWAAKSPTVNGAGGKKLTYVAPSVALSCLMSVPVDVANDVALVDYLLPYVTWHSTLGYLKNPPTGYLLPGVDVVAGLQEIRQKLRNNQYTNQYEFTGELVGVFQAAGDGHLTYNAALNGVFSFNRALFLASVSSDGLELPKIYDVQMLGDGPMPPDIVSIDGIDIQTYLVNHAPLIAGKQDPDAQYNVLFHSIAQAAASSGDAFVVGKPSLADTNNVTFSNGSTKIYENKAIINVAFDNISTPEQLHQVVEVQGIPSPVPTTPGKIRVRQASQLTVAPGYPSSPVAVHKEGVASGYFLNGTHQDTCVLVIYSFESSGSIFEQMVELRRVVRTLLQKCTDAKRDKLVIDLSGNNGGQLFSGYDVYRNLFPSAIPWSGNRVRAHPALNATGQALFGTSNSIFPLSEVDANGTPFPSWSAIYGPVDLSADNETNILTYNLTSPITSENGVQFFITGYDPSSTPSPQPFKAENIVVVTDGICASTCTILTRLLVHEQGVRTIALGGRPMTAPMQAVGGVKGAQMFKFSTIQSWAKSLQDAKVVVSDDLRSAMPSAGNPPLQPTDMGSAGTLNFRNAYLQNGTEGPPLQFIYEAANCRRFYKVSYLTDLTALWNDVADVAWNGGKCVSGSSANQDGTMGSAALAYSDQVKSTQLPYSGPGSLTNTTWLSLLSNTTGTDGPSGNNPSDAKPSGTSSPSPSPSSKNAAGSLSVAHWLTTTPIILAGLLML